MKIVDLFSGLGGLTAGCVEAAKELNKDLQIILACDMNSSCVDFYKSNFKDYLIDFYSGNILDLSDESLKGIDAVDYLFAGPPCQGHSDLNNSSRRSDPRNLLYLETIRLINLLSPNVFIIENVPTVVHSKERVVSTLKETLGEEYSIEEYVVDFTLLGIAQTRKRHVLIGRKGPLNSDLFSSIYNKFKPLVLKDVIFDLDGVEDGSMFNTASRMSSDNKKRTEYLINHNLLDLPNSQRPKCHQGNHSYKSMYGRLDWNKPAQTITGGFGSMGQGRFLHPVEPRVITPHEAARIQGLPDWLDFNMINKRGELQKMIGNAVPPALSKELIIKFETEK